MNKRWLTGREFLETHLGALQGAQKYIFLCFYTAPYILGALQGAQRALKKFPTVAVQEFVATGAMAASFIVLQNLTLVFLRAPYEAP